MFNRFLYEKLLTQNYEKQANEKISSKLNHKRKSLMQSSSQKYKSKVRNFLVELASHPISLGSYEPPVKTITRQSPNTVLQRLGRSQMIINGFQTVQKRTQENEKNNKILDYSPTKLQWANQQFRQRSKLNEIHKKQMTFGKTQSKVFTKSDSLQLLKKRSQSLKNFTLPSLMNNKESQKRTYFKAIQQMANSISSNFLYKNKAMNQSKNDRTGLQNRLMVVMDGKQVKIQSTAFDLLGKSNFIKKRANSERTLKSYGSVQIND